MASKRNRGKFWLSLTSGEAVGQPLAEWAYVTPDHPRGLKVSDLASSNHTTQRSTCRFWFVLNYEPYDLSKIGGPWGGYGTQVPVRYAPAPLTSLHLLTEEFGQVLERSTIEAVSSELHGQWMDRLDAGPELSTLSADGLRRELSQVLGRLIVALEEIPASGVHGEVGHNQPEDSPFTVAEKAEAVETIREFKASADDGEFLDFVSLADMAFWLRRSLAKLGGWLLPKLDLFAEGFAREGGAHLGKNLVPVGTAVIAISVLHADAAAIAIALITASGSGGGHASSDK